MTEKYSIVRAKDIKNNIFIVNIPSDRLESTLKYTFKNPDTYLSISNQWVAQQNRVEANSDFLAPPSAYTLWRIDGGVKIKKLALGFTINNTLNTSYREYLNRFRYFTDDMGRNISVRVKYII